MLVVDCYLWFPDADGALDALYLTALPPEEWSALADWVRSRSAELPALFGLLSAPLPLRVPPAGIPLLAAECDRVDWDTLAGPALGGFAALSLVVGQAAGQLHVGLRFGTAAERAPSLDRGG
jgi:hypothetical protein